LGCAPASTPVQHTGHYPETNNHTYTYRVALDKRAKEFIEGVEILDVVFGFVGCISDTGVHFPPALDGLGLGSVQDANNRLASRAFNLFKQSAGKQKGLTNVWESMATHVLNLAMRVFQ
jgi:hypothetical protein